MQGFWIALEKRLKKVTSIIRANAKPSKPLLIKPTPGGCRMVASEISGH
jgi:hypothetical protein